MSSLILDTYSSPTAFTITVASLAASTAGVGRQGTIVDNTTNRYQDIIVYAKIKLGTSPTANTAIYLYLIRDDGAATPIRTDSAGASDAAWTAKNAMLIGTLITGTSPSTGDVLSDAFLVRRVGPKFTIGIVNNTGVPLDSTGTNHVIEFVGVNSQAQ